MLYFILVNCSVYVWEITLTLESGTCLCNFCGIWLQLWWRFLTAWFFFLKNVKTIINCSESLYWQKIRSSYLAKAAHLLHFVKLNPEALVLFTIFTHLSLSFYGPGHIKNETSECAVRKLPKNLYLVYLEVEGSEMRISDWKKKWWIWK